MSDNTPPPDLTTEEELEFYQLFGEIRQEIHDFVGSLTDSVLQHIELLQSDDERIEQPNYLDMFSVGLSSFVNVITSWKTTPPEDESIDDDHDDHNDEDNEV